MAAMSSFALMTHRADVKRRVGGSGEDKLNRPITAEQEVHTDLPCKLWPVSGTTDYDNSKGATVSNFKGIVAHDADVRIEDLIVDVRDRIGTLLFSKNFRVKESLIWPGEHLALTLEAVS